MGVVVHKDDGPGSSLLPEQIFSVHSFQGGLSYTYRATEERTGIIRLTHDNGGATSTLTPHWSTPYNKHLLKFFWQIYALECDSIQSSSNEIYPKYFCQHYLKGNICTYRRWISDNCQHGTLICACPHTYVLPLVLACRFSSTGETQNTKSTTNE